ncbi:MAG TPA: HEAT repeat domain-containing protein [Longimicrobiales bacterium]|nr:HEAT repeat domain-containing protein [Longimicrobiales bacterium]
MGLFGWFGPPDIDALKARGRVDKLIRALEDERVRTEAARALGDVGDPRAVRPLVAALGDAEAPVREEAARALGRLNDPSAAGALAAALADDAWRVQDAAASALRSLGSRDAVPRLREHMASAPAGVRVLALSTIAALDGDAGLSLAVEAVSAGDEELFEAALELISQHASSTARPHLLAALEHRSLRIRQKAIGLLEALHHRGKRSPVVASDWRPDDARLQAIVTLTTQDWRHSAGLTTEHIESLLWVVEQRTPDLGMIRTLGALGGRGALALLSRWWNDGNVRDDDNAESLVKAIAAVVGRTGSDLPLDDLRSVAELADQTAAAEITRRGG